MALLNKRNTLILTILAASIGLAKAQITGPYGYYNDAVILAQPAIQGTARIQSMGGAQTALGGDISSIAGNPAGLGFIKHSQATISPSLYFNTTDGAFQGKTTSDYRANFNIGNLGVVFSAARDEIVGGEWRGGSFAIGMTRINSYNQDFQYRGDVLSNMKVDQRTGIRNTTNSYMDYLVNKTKALGIDNKVHDAGYSAYFGSPAGSALSPDQAEAYQGYRAYLLDNSPPAQGSRPANIFGKYYGRTIPLGDVQQRLTVKNSGAQNQFDFAYGGNVSDKFYFGASLGLINYWRTENITYQETQTKLTDSLYSDSADVEKFKNYSINRNIYTSYNGQGVNFKVGVIIRPQPWLRLGGNIQSPTIYNIKQTQSFNVTASFPKQPGEVFPNDQDSKFNGEFSYQVVTPMKWNGGVAFIFEKSGLLTLDVDYLKYGNTLLKADNGGVDADNDAIKSMYKSVLNLRGGAEYKVDIFAFRVGAAFAGSPYQTTTNTNYINNGVRTLTCGAGIRTPDYFVDMAIVNNSSQRINAALDYSGLYSPKATINSSATSIVFTAGIMF